MTKLEKKYEELVVYLKALTISHSPDEEYENRLLAEIAVLKEQQESKEQETVEEILERVHNIERMSTCMEDSYVLKRTTIRAMREYAQQESKITDETKDKNILHNETNDMKHSIKERAKKVPAKIKLKVWVHCLWIDIKHYLNKICESCKSSINEQPKYDEKYLNECIKKAAPRLSKIKDVDKALNELRGIEQEVRTAIEIVFVALYNSCIHESAFGIISIHDNRKDAEMAMEFHKKETEKEEGEISDYQAWMVREYKIESSYFEKQKAIKWEITDEEILKEARRQCIKFGYQYIFVDGAEFVRKWYRDQIKTK